MLFNLSYNFETGRKRRSEHERVAASLMCTLGWRWEYRSCAEYFSSSYYAATLFDVERINVQCSSIGSLSCMSAEQSLAALSTLKMLAVGRHEHEIAMHGEQTIVIGRVVCLSVYVSVCNAIHESRLIFVRCFIR